MTSAASDGIFVTHLHSNAMLIDLVDDEWRHESLSNDDFDQLPSADVDSDSDEVRTVPTKRKAEEKWAELCLDEFQ